MIEHVRLAAGRRPACKDAATVTCERAPARFGRLKDDTTVLVVDVDLRSEAVRLEPSPL